MRDRDMLKRADETSGYFALDEAELLMRTVESAPTDATILEIGCYRGRSTLFGLAAAGSGQRWISVDSFRTAAAYAGHSYQKLTEHVVDRRHTLLPMTLAEAVSHLRGIRFDVALIDADHSLLGVAQDLALSIELSHAGGIVLCHDVCDLFPGVELVVDGLCRTGVLRPLERVGSLAALEIVTRPTWLTDPDVYRDGEL